MVGGGKRTLDVFFPRQKAQNERWEVVRGSLGGKEFKPTLVVTPRGYKPIYRLLPTRPYVENWYWQKHAYM